MNKIKKISVLILLPVFIYLAIGFFCRAGDKGFKGAVGQNLSAQDNTPKDFMNIIFTFDWKSNVPGQWVSSQLDKIKNELHYNAVQVYGGNGNELYGQFGTSLNSSQVKNTKNFMDSIGVVYGLKGLYGRTTLEKLCYGQRLLYEAEKTGNNFCYSRSSTGRITNDNGRTVAYASKDLKDRADTLRAGIIENLQHSDILDYSYNSKGTWYLKPVLKIKQSDFNSMNPETEVIKIVVNGFKENEITVVKTIRLKNFRDSSSKYNGAYKEIYNFTGESEANELRLSGAIAPGGLNNGRTGGYADPDDFKKACHVDFKIYWCGNVDVWFDKLIVDDESGNKLFDVNPKVNLDNEIREEVSNFSEQENNIAFYADEIKYSNYECVRHVISVMKQANQNAELACITSPYFNNFGLRNTDSIFTYFLNLTKWKYVMFDMYQFFSEIKTVPDNFTDYDPRMPVEWKANKEIYNNWIQNKTFCRKTKDPNNTYYGSYIYILNKLRNEINAMQNKPELIIIPQLHSSMQILNKKENNNTVQYYSGGVREPTNEEIEAQAMLALAYGTSHLGWFVYSSAEWKYPDGNGECYHGLLNENMERRTKNLYYQNKWLYVSELNKKILNFKPYLDNSSWTGAYSVHYEGANKNFISDLKSIFRNSSGSFTDNPAYCDKPDERYWEIGFFEPYNNSGKNFKYFMLVNRRCFPEINSDGDMRYVKIKFNPDFLEGFDVWKIIDVNSGDSFEFNKNNNDFTDLGNKLAIFMPGEGKLFKLSPVR